MRQPVAVFNVVDDAVLITPAGVNGHTVELVTVPGKDSCFIADIEGTDTSLTFVPLDGGGYQIILCTQEDTLSAFEEFIDGIDTEVLVDG